MSAWRLPRKLHALVGWWVACCLLFSALAAHAAVPMSSADKALVDAAGASLCSTAPPAADGERPSAPASTHSHGDPACTCGPSFALLSHGAALQLHAPAPEGLPPARDEAPTRKISLPRPRQRGPPALP